MSFVIDTSALLRLFIPDGPIPDGMESALREAERGNTALLAPELIIAEAAQVLLKKNKMGVLTQKEMGELLDCITSLPIRLFKHKPIIQHSVELALEHKLTVYDALFLALADGKKSSLITADRLLLRAAKKMGLN